MMHSLNLLKLITAAVLVVLVAGCSTIVHEMEDERAYENLKVLYESESSFSSDEEYLELDSLFDHFLTTYTYSDSYDNAQYYRARLHQKWAEQKEGEEQEKHLYRALEILDLLDQRSSFMDEALYRKAELLDELWSSGFDVDEDDVIEAYQLAYEFTPTSTSGIKAKERLEELN